MTSSDQVRIFQKVTSVPERSYRSRSGYAAAQLLDLPDAGLLPAAHGPRPDFWPEAERWPGFNFGYLWFLEHLLIYALLYAALRALVRRDSGLAGRSPPSHSAIFGYAVLLAGGALL